MRVATVLSAGAAAIAVAACGSDANEAGSSSASCASSVSWRDVLYRGVTSTEERATAPLGSGELPACGIGEEGAPVSVVRLDGIDPQIAVGVEERPGGVYLAPGFAADLRSHPLHDQLYAGRPRGQATGLRCGASDQELSGTIDGTPSLGQTFALVTAFGRRDLALRPDADVALSVRAGVPFFRQSANIDIRGRSCRDADGKHLFLISRLRGGS